MRGSYCAKKILDKSTDIPYIAGKRAVHVKSFSPERRRNDAKLDQLSSGRIEFLREFAG